MAGEEVYLARLGVWAARALGASGTFTRDMDTDGIGVRMPEAIVADPAVQAAGATLADASGLLSAAADELDVAIGTGAEGDLVPALLHLAEGLYEFFDAAVALVTVIQSRAA